MDQGGSPELKSSREKVQKVCGLLVRPSPATLKDCSALLETAVEDLRSMHIAGGGPADRSEAGTLRTAIGQASALLQTAAHYHAGWASWLDARTNGYESGGRPAGAARRKLLCMEG